MAGYQRPFTDVKAQVLYEGVLSQKFSVSQGTGKGRIFAPFLGMLFSANFDRMKVNPFVYIKFWRQACLPALVFGSELFTVTPNLLQKLERCQMWFLKRILFVPKFVPNLLILPLTGLNSVESETDIRKLLFLGRLLTEPKMSFVVKSLFQSRATSYFDPNTKSIGVLPSICDTLCKFNLCTYFETRIAKHRAFEPRAFEPRALSPRAFIILILFTYVPDSHFSNFLKLTSGLLGPVHMMLV